MNTLRPKPRPKLAEVRVLRRQELTPGDTLVHACGHPCMIEDVKERLLPKGYRVEEERFWKED